MLSLSTWSLAICVSCAAAAAVSSSAASVSQSSSSSPAAAPAPAKTTTPQYYAATATTISTNSLPSGLGLTATTEVPNYSDSRFPWAQFWSGADPAQTSVAIQPKVTNPLTNVVFEKNLTAANTVPHYDLLDDIWFFPSTNTTLEDPSAQMLTPGFNLSLLSTPASSALAMEIKTQIIALVNGTNSTNSTASCETCMAALQLGQTLAQQAPWEAPGVMTQLCELYNFETEAVSTCAESFAAATYGSTYTQVLAKAVLNTGFDAQWLCNTQLKFCKAPGVTPYLPNATSLWSTPKPSGAAAPTVQSGTPRLKVVHLSDLHLDPRYYLSSEANCTLNMCCRQESSNVPYGTTYQNASLPAPPFGSYYCDAPYDLIVSAMQAVPDLTGTRGTGPAMTLFTGDLVSHDQTNEINSPYSFYEESVMYTLMYQYLTGDNHSAPVYASISNHDNRYGSGWNMPNVYQPRYIQSLYQEDYNQLAGLWEQFGWIDAQTAQVARNNYASYSIMTSYGVRIISFNANFYYPTNVWNYVNTSNADSSGIFTWLANELQAAEDNNERVWIILHEPSGWDGTNSIPNQTDLYFQIIARYSPHVIAAIFGGHTVRLDPNMLADKLSERLQHEDETFISYDNNGTDISASGALVQTWLTGSVTPYTNINPRIRMYEIDSQTFDVVDAYTWYSNVTANFNNIRSQGAEWLFEYSTRQTYGGNITWPDYAPLNATWWHYVTEQMGYNPSLIELFSLYESGISTPTANCTSQACIEAKICYIQSGSNPQAGRCTTGYGASPNRPS